jgi:hypothetical protein
MLLVVIGFAAPDTAWAGCSHLVGSRSDPFMKLQQLDDLILFGSSTSPGGNGGQSPLGRPDLPRRTPCSGASCSSGRVPLPVSTITQGPEGRDRWGALGAGVVADNTSAQVRTTNEPALASSGEKSSIFHPPRV